MRVATCHCSKNCPVYITTGELPDKTTIQCDGKRVKPHLYPEITVDSEILNHEEFVGNKKRPTLTSVKAAVCGWLDLLRTLADESARQLEGEESGGTAVASPSPAAGAAATQTGDTGATSDGLPTSQAELTDALEGMSILKPIPRRSSRLIKKDSIASLPPDLKPKFITANGSNDSKHPSGTARESKPTQVVVWITASKNMPHWVKITAAGMKHIGMMILRYGLPFGICTLTLLRAWKTESWGLFLEALRPIVKLCWPEKLIERVVGKDVAKVLGFILSSEVSLYQLQIILDAVRGAPSAGLALSLAPKPALTATQRGLNTTAQLLTVVEAAVDLSTTGLNITAPNPAHAAEQGDLNKASKQRESDEKEKRRLRNACD